MGRFDNLRNRIAELIDNRESEPEPKGYAGDDQPTGTIVGNYLENNPPKEELEEYWQIYRDVGLVNSAIDNFASEVIEPGWYITADTQETADELTEYMENVAVVNLEHDQNFSELAWKMIVEREVRGTVFIEKVTDDQGRHQALYPLQNDTITIYTKPGKAMLPAPDDPVSDPVDLKVGGEARTPVNDEGETGAYVQFDDLKPRWDAKEEVVYIRDEILHWPRDADIGAARGTSRIRTIQERAEGWLQKTRDNDAAIRSKAWPMIIFNMGTEDNPWSREQVDDFLEDYDQDNLEPGLMQAVSGDVSVDEFAGETADIEAPLQHDINAIMSGLPGPVYATGGFSQNVAPAVAQAQQRQFIKEVKAVRRDLENKVTPYLRDVARDYDLSDPSSVEFHIGRPDGQVAPEDVSGSIIRYTSDADPSNQGAAGAQGGGGQNTTNEGGQSGVGAPTPGQSNRANQANQANQASSTSQSSFAGQDYVVDPTEAAELADPRLVSTTDDERTLSSRIADLLTTARDNAIDEFERQYGGAPVAGAGEIDGVARRAIEATLQDPNTDLDSRPIFESVIEDTIDTLNQDNHTPTMDLAFGVRHRQSARDHADSLERSTRSAAEELLNDLSDTVRASANRGDPSDEIVERVESHLDDETIERRAEIIAHMELQSAVNNTKLTEYERSRDVAGIEVINTCGPNTTRLCEHLAGCGTHDGAVARFDADETMSEQLMDDVPESVLFDGFDPLPPAPPFHFGCTSEIVPITDT